MARTAAPPAARSRPRSLAAAAAAGALLLLCSAPWWAALPRFGRIPHNDYYLVLAELMEPSGAWRRDWAAWAGVRSNEHLVAVPALAYAANVGLTGGDNRALSAFALLALSATGAALVAARPRALRAGSPASALAAAAIGVVIFAPAQAHSLAMGFSGSMWLVSNLFAVTSLLAGARHVREGGAAPLAAALACGGLGLITYSTSTAVLPLLLGAALLARRRAGTLLPLAAASLVALLLPTLGYRRPALHPDPSFDAGAVAGFALRYLGGPLSGDPTAAALLGGAGVLAGVLLWILLLARLRAARGREAGELLPWGLLQAYAAVNAVGTAVGRAGLVPDASLSSRYSTVALLFWVGLLVPAAALAARRWPPRGWVRPAAAGALIAGLACLLWVRGAPVLALHLRRAAAEGVAEAALRAAVDYRPALLPVTHAPGALLRLRDALRARGHVPFERREPGLPGDPRVVERRGLAPDPPVATAVVESLRIRGGWQLVGSAEVEEPLRWLLFVDASGRLCGLGAPGEPTRDPVTVERAGGGARRVRWTAYLAGCEPTSAEPFALLGHDPRLRRVSTGR